MKYRIEEIQSVLQAENLDGWLLYNFRNSNHFVSGILELPPELLCTRRYFYFIPAAGEPHKLVHRIEQHMLDSLPGKKTTYASWQSLWEGITSLLKGSKRIAMEYSPLGAIPYVSVVDGGTLELIKSTGVAVVSSATLLQYFEARWTQRQYELHMEAAVHLREIVDKVFAYIRSALQESRLLTEFDVQQYMLSEFHKRKLITSSPPNCSVNEHSANPHYEPTADHHGIIRKGDFILIDLWAKCDAPEAVYADITWVAYAGEEVPSEYENVFQIVKGARDTALAFVQESLRTGKQFCGYEVDDIARHVITKAGYGDLFVHRTGHSLGTEVHGNGANIDNLETRDERKIIPNTAFTLEPGIYKEGAFGVRSEINVYLQDEQTAVVTGLPVQEHVIPLLV